MPLVKAGRKGAERATALAEEESDDTDDDDSEEEIKEDMKKIEEELVGEMIEVTALLSLPACRFCAPHLDQSKASSYLTGITTSLPHRHSLSAAPLSSRYIRVLPRRCCSVFLQVGCLYGVDHEVLVAILRRNHYDFQAPARDAPNSAYRIPRHHVPGPHPVPSDPTP